jgi:hypothetical protein
MAKYLKGKIYKIINDETDKIYIGSTYGSLWKRFSRHKNEYSLWVEDRTRQFKSSFELLPFGSARIELIEDFPCNSKEELLTREQFYMNENKLKCVNKLNAILTHDERKVYRLKWYHEHSDRSKKYREDNAEHIQIKSAEYYEENKEHLNAIRSEKITCDCGSEIRRDSKARHLRSIVHQTWLESQATLLVVKTEDTPNNNPNDSNDVTSS